MKNNAHSAISPHLAAMFCPYHSTAYLVEDDRAGDVICSECGLVVGDRVLDVLDWIWHSPLSLAPYGQATLGQ